MAQASVRRLRPATSTITPICRLEPIEARAIWWQRKRAAAAVAPSLAEKSGQRDGYANHQRSLIR
jgi:hypothetical protein